MKVIDRTEERLVLQEKPWLVGFVGGLFVVAGGGVAIASTERLFGLAFAAVGAVLVLAFANTVTAVFDRTASRFTRSTRGLLRRSEIGHSLNDLVGVRVDASHSGNPSHSYRIVLVLRSGAPLPLTTAYSSGKSDKEHLARMIQEFLNLSAAPGVPLPGFRDLFNLMTDPNAAARLSQMYSGPVAALEEAVRNQPDNVDARRQLGAALALQNRPSEAKVHLEAARQEALRRGDMDVAKEIEALQQRLQ